MEPRPSELQRSLLHDPTKIRQSGLIVSRDLIFITKIRRTALDLGYTMLVANAQSQAMSMITSYHPPVVLVDLTAGEMAASAALKAYQELVGVDAWLIAFGPHVDADALAAAKAAGFHVVMPRSLFAAKLPEFLRRFFSQPPEKTG